MLCYVQYLPSFLTVPASMRFSQIKKCIFAEKSCPTHVLEHMLCIRMLCTCTNFTVVHCAMLCEIFTVISNGPRHPFLRLLCSDGPILNLVKLLPSCFSLVKYTMVRAIKCLLKHQSMCVCARVCVCPSVCLHESLDGRECGYPEVSL